MYGTLTGDVSRSGNTVTLSSLRCTFTAAGAWGTDSGYWCAIYSGDTELSRDTTLIMNSGSGYMDLPNCSVTVSGSATSYTFNFRTADGYRVNFTVSFSANTPSGLSLSNVVPGVNEVTFALSVTNWNGTPGEFEFSLGNSTTISQGLRIPRKLEEATTSSLSATATISNSSQHTGSSFSIEPNTTYYAFGYATNSGGATAEISGYTSVVTLAAVPAVDVSSVTDNSATLSYSAAADGGVYDKTIQYSLDGTSWQTAATITGGSAVSSTFVISGLSAGTTYNVRTRVSTTAGTTAGSTITVTTSAPVQSCKLFGSVGNVSKKTVKWLGSVGGRSKYIIKIYASVNGKTKLVFEDPYA